MSAHLLCLADAFGHLASLERLVPPRRLRMHALQWHFLTHWSPESDHPSLPVPLSRAMSEDGEEPSSQLGFRFGTPAPNLHLYSDSSRSGWDARLLNRLVSAVCSGQEMLFHIYLHGLQAMFWHCLSFRKRSPVFV